MITASLRGSSCQLLLFANALTALLELEHPYRHATTPFGVGPAEDGGLVMARGLTAER